GQRLLAARGITTALRLGTIVYAPGTAARHPIHPHVWLESGTHLIDFSTLPRWGKPTVVPLARVTRSPRRPMPGAAQVLTLLEPCDEPCLGWLAEHRARFRTRAAETDPGPLGEAPAPRVW
ncbi:MAG: hypothetical protein PVF91_15105, partial [Chromatiales bacterium]